MSIKLRKPKLFSLKVLIPLMIIAAAYYSFVGRSVVFQDLCASGDKEKIVLTARGCWFDFYSVKQKVISNRPNDKFFVELDIPLPIISRSRNWSKGEYDFVKLSVPLSLHMKNVSGISRLEHSAFTILRLSINDKGLEITIKGIVDGGEYIELAEDTLYRKFKRKNTARPLFLVPKNMMLMVAPFYLRCEYNCSYYSVYKHIGLDMSVPSSWVQYPQLLNAFSTNFIDSIVVDSNIDRQKGEG